MDIDHRMCAYISEGKQCDAPASIHVKQPAPAPYAHLMMDMWMCAEHYDLWCKEENSRMWACDFQEDTDATA